MPLYDHFLKFRSPRFSGEISVLEVGTERIPNPMSGQPPLDTKMSDIAVPLYAGPVHVRRSSILKMTDPNLRFEYSGRSSLIGQFEYTGP